MTSRSRTMFWGRGGVLAFLLAIATAILGHPAWEVERAQEALANHEVYCRFDDRGPRWFESIVPTRVANAWFSRTWLTCMKFYDPNPEFTEADWKAALPLMRMLPHVRGIIFTGPVISQPTIESLADFPQLQFVSLSLTSVSDNDLVLLAQCPRLTILSLIGTGITDEGLSHIARLSELRELHLDPTQVTEDGLIHLRQLTKLTRLSLSEGDFSFMIWDVRVD